MIQTLKLKVYTANSLKWTSLYLGVPEIGSHSDAETEIQLVLSRNYDSPVDYDIDEINHFQKEGLVNEDNTTASIDKVKCQSMDNSEKCHEISIDFTVMAPLKHDIVAISAMDNHRRNHITFINEGVEFTGTPLLDPHTDSLMQKKTKQGDAEIIYLTQQDRRYNVWEDQNGYLWMQNDHGTWIQITTPEFERHQDKISNVMTRQNSNFANMIEFEKQRATLVFDSSDIMQDVDGYFTYDYSGIDRDVSKLEKYSKELKIESAKAEKIMKYIINPAYQE